MFWNLGKTNEKTLLVWLQEAQTLVAETNIKKYRSNFFCNRLYYTKDCRRMGGGEGENMLVVSGKSRRRPTT